jgi:hypothetical protein
VLIVSGNRLKVVSSVLTPAAKPRPVVGQRNINIPMGSSHIWDRAVPKLVSSRIKSRGKLSLTFEEASPLFGVIEIEPFRLIKL